MPLFYYFGYGSNLSVVSLRAKGVNPLSSEPAVLTGWRLAFDIPDFFPIEGGTGNIRPERGHSLHGVLHGCRDQDLEALDRLEALGVTYERIEASVTTYAGRSLRAYIYVGLPECAGPELLPSERYRNILVAGASSMRLMPSYIESLRALPALPRASRPVFEVPASLPTFGIDDLKDHPHWVGLAGSVFDMSEASPRLAYLQKLFARRDVSLLFLKRMDTSRGDENFAQLVTGDLEPGQRAFLNAYLHEFAREFRLVGSLDYTRRAAHRISSVPPPQTAVAPVPRVLPDNVPGAKVLAAADAHYEATGNENTGFLSFEHGFMPRKPPLKSLSATHAAWDQAASELPRMYEDLSLRRRIESLPMLSGRSDALPDEEVLRATAILAMLSHAYWYAEVHPPEELPQVLRRPWAELRKRLGRDQEVLSYIDLIVYNWQLIDPASANPMRLENLRLLIPTVDNDAERRFYLTQTEILARCAPIVGAVVRAQAAAAIDDREAVEAGLMSILASLRQVVRESLFKIDPNPASEHYVNPVVWAKSVAPFAVPFTKGVLGPSGTSSPIFNLLDVFFGRKRFASFLGNEIRELRGVYPPLWRKFLKATGEHSVGDYIAKIDDVNLRGLWRESLDTYAGDEGFLGRHRMKVYGYLELGFKVGRAVTIGGFQGLFDDRTWDQVDSELEASRAERLAILPDSCHHVRVAGVRCDDGVVPSGIAHVSLDVTGTGIHYEAGDRCGILPESAPELIEKTLAALGATGEESIPLTDEWQQAMRLRKGYEGVARLSLRDVLRFGKIRPVVPRVAEALHALSQDSLLKERIEEQQVHHWELWDLLEYLKTGGFDPSVLLGTDTIVAEAMCRVLPPEEFRSYSISSVMSHASLGKASEIELTVGQISYRTEGIEGVAEVQRRGTASSFLRRAAGRKEPISLIVRTPPRFALPRQPSTPIVMIAGGTGFSPFRGFLVERARLRDAGPAMLLLGLRDRSHFRPYEAELGQAIEDGRTEVQVAFSRDDAEPVFAAGEFEYRSSPRCYVTDRMLQERTARELWAQIHPDNPVGAHVYICGRSAFAKGVLEALRQIFRRFAEGDEGERDRFAAECLDALVSQGRLKQEIFSGDAPQRHGERGLPVSEIVQCNGPDAHWMVIDGTVYDVGAFLTQHPGGAHVLLGYAGLDATAGFSRVHGGHTEIEAMLEAFALGPVRRLRFGDEAIDAQTEAGATTTTLKAMHDAWVRLTYLVVEMENALRNDQSLQQERVLRIEGQARSLYKLERALETHQRFVESYLGSLVGSRGPQLWRRMHAVLGKETSDWMNLRFVAIGEGEAAAQGRAYRMLLDEALGELVAAPLAELRLRLDATMASIAELDASFLGELKSVLCDGLRTFERLEGRVLSLAGDDLVLLCRRIPELVERYHRRFAALVREQGWNLGTRRSSSPSPQGEGQLLETVASTSYWELSMNRPRGVVVVRRTPVAVDSLEELAKQNEAIIGRLPRADDGLGIVVDVRAAPARNDVAFENTMRRFRAEVSRRFARVAVLLDSDRGVLQVNRLSRAEGAAHFATRNEAAAMKFAMGTG